MGVISGNATLPIRLKLFSISFCLKNNWCSYPICCHLQPPQVPKCSQTGSTRLSEALCISIAVPSKYAFLFLVVCTDTISPGTALFMNTTRPSAALAIAFPLAPASITSRCSNTILF